ncbi:DUF2271 domain-containing protein [Orenia marismortui]|uniref:DUF2271 domain-containing protein n=1 Tax=Orenia marismortui TaxID=46469 RepID=UPI0003703637|nr:DUF2271 domain-containing protein [Orenia marismortui]
MFKSRMKLMALVMILVVLISGIIRAQSEGRISVEVKPGERYKDVTWYWLGIFPIKSNPQMAIWLEDEQGNYIDTIYVTESSGKSKWSGGKDIRRPDALPIWSHKRGIKYNDGLYMPTKDKPLVDAITGATPKKGFTRKWIIPADIKLKQLVIRLEVNQSIDYNETYKKKLSKNNFNYNDTSGQPSLLWEGEIEIKDGFTTVLKKVGHGHPSGKNGKLFRNLETITTANEIIESIEIKYLK